MDVVTTATTDQALASTPARTYDLHSSTAAREEKMRWGREILRRREQLVRASGEVDREEEVIASAEAAGLFVDKGTKDRVARLRRFVSAAGFGQWGYEREWMSSGGVGDWGEEDGREMVRVLAGPAGTSEEAG